MRLFGVVVLSALALNAQDAAGVRVLLGVTDPQSTTWDGSVTVEGGSISSLEPWRFESSDRINGTSWNLSTHPIRLFGNGSQVNGRPIRNIVANGLIVRLAKADPNATLKVTTTQGTFEVKLTEIPYGRSVAKLDGKVFLDRVPPTSQITATPEEEDFPSAAAHGQDGAWLAYISFQHHPDHAQLRLPLRTPISDFSKLKAPPGGDRLYVRHYTKGVWEPAIAVTPPGQDLYRTALAVDGKGRPWVFWSQNSQGNYDVFAAAVENGKVGTPIQLSQDKGSDIDPVAVTDSNGNVWMAWQGWRSGRGAIFAVSQKGDRFSQPMTVSQPEANEWNPSIAAGKGGRVTIAWDSYRNGNYDIYMRSVSGSVWGPEKPVAASARYEAYPSLAYDASGRLWVAYEEGGKGWGKDFGAYSSGGVALYQSRVIRIRGFEADGRPVDLPADVGSVLPGVPSIFAEIVGEQKDYANLDPDPELVKRREAFRPLANQQNPKNTLPRLLVDASGRIWLAFRSAHPIWWNPVGTVWTEHVVSYDGVKWTKPIFLTHSDNLLDNRPALVSPKGGQLLTIGNADNRREFQLAQRNGQVNGNEAELRQDPYNNDLYLNQIELGPAQRPLAATAAKTAITAAPLDRGDRAAVRRLREYRSTSSGGLQILRGEFHRHSEISMDGGFDGTILDQWRYILDAAALDWVGCCDHDNGGGREYSWWITQKLTDIFNTPQKFVAMFNYERSVPYPEGHRNVLFAQRGIRTLPRLPITKPNDPGHAPDTQMLYGYLKHFNGVVASHTSATGMGTDWRDNDPDVEPVVEIFQGDRQNYEMPGAPRSSSETDAIGGWRPKGFVNLALEKGFRLGFQASSDHVSTHMSYCNILVKDATRESVIEALKRRHVYGATDNILAEVRSGDHIMGDAFTTNEAPALQVRLTGTSKFTKVHIVRNGQYVYSTSPGAVDVRFTWRDNSPEAGKTSYYYVRGEQDNGEIVWASPMWITYAGKR